MAGSHKCEIDVLPVLETVLQIVFRNSCRQSFQRHVVSHAVVKPFPDLFTNSDLLMRIRQN